MRAERRAQHVPCRRQRILPASRTALDSPPVASLPERAELQRALRLADARIDLGPLWREHVLKVVVTAVRDDEEAFAFVVRIRAWWRGLDRQADSLAVLGQEPDVVPARLQARAAQFPVRDAVPALACRGQFH